MERSTHPTPINPNAKYLPNSISNVLSSIQKFDQGTLAWPTGPRKRHTWTKKLCRVPLAGTASALISKPRGSKSKYCEKVNKKNTFYQILQASQDQPSFETSDKRKRVEVKSHADNIYNDIYDIVRAYLHLKRQPQSGGQSADSPKVSAPLNEIYRVPETTTLQKYSKGEEGKSESHNAKVPIVKFYRPPAKPKEHRPHIVSNSVSKSKNQMSGVSKRHKLTIKEDDKGQNIVQEKPKDSAKARHGSSTAQSHRKQVNKAKKRNTENRWLEGNAKKSVKLQKKFSKDVPHLNKITKAVQERVLGSSKNRSRFQHSSAKVPHQKDISRGSDKLENKSAANKDKSKEMSKFQPESPKVENSQDIPRPSITKATPRKQPNNQGNRQIIPADQSPARVVSKPQKSIYTKAVFKNIANKSHNLTDQKLYETRTTRKHSNENTKMEKNSSSKRRIDSRTKLNNRFAHRILNEIYKTRGAKKSEIEKEGRLDKSKKSKIQESVTKKKTKIPESSKGGQKSIIDNTIYWPSSPYDPYEAPPVIPSKISSVTPEPAAPSRLTEIRKNTCEASKSRKVSVTSEVSYQEKLWKLKEYLNNMDDYTTDTVSLDIEGILDSDLLYYPYDDIYKRNSATNNAVDKNKKEREPKPKPPENELKNTEIEKKCKKSACIMCKSIGRPEKDAPFLVQMRQKQKRQELLAYRAHIAMCNKPSQRSRARQLAIGDLDKKLYTLEDKDIVFYTRPKRSNSSIFPSSSKTRACPTRCHSFTSPKESSRIICS